VLQSFFLSFFFFFAVAAVLSFAIVQMQRQWRQSCPGAELSIRVSDIEQRWSAWGRWRNLAKDRNLL
jgi:hypothetical protein